MYKLLSIVLLALGLTACGNSDKSDETTINQFAALRDVAKEELANNKAAAVSIAIYHNGEVVFAEAFGEKIKDSGEMVSVDTLFQLGSTTKMFTGLATLKLIDQGMLNIDDTLVMTLPNIQYPSAMALSWEDVSIHHLLTHQGGFLDAYIDSSVDDQLTDYMTTTYAQQNRQMNPPGIFYNYSNPNWSYLGAIVEYLNNTPYAEYMEQNVFEPMGMQRTSMNRNNVKADGNYALGFQTDDNGEGYKGYMTDIDQIQPQPSSLPAGSETWSTPTEQLKMAAFLLNGDSDLLSNHLKNEMVKPQVHQEFGGVPMHYGYGIFVDDGFMHNDQWYSEKIWQHGGNTLAYTSMFWILPEKNIAVSIMSSGAFTNFEDTMLSALNALTELPTPTAIPTSPANVSDFEKHAGIYDTGAFTIEVSVDENQLKISSLDLDTINVPYDETLYSIGNNTFLTEIDNEEVILTFFPSHTGGESVYMRNRGLVGIKEGY